MANTSTGLVWICDTVGIISKKSVWVRSATIIPNAAGDAALLSWWDELNPTTNSELGLNATISGSATFTDTDTGNDKLTAAAFAAGSVVKIIGSDGLPANQTYHLIATAGNNDRFITTAASLTNEVAVNYHITDYPVRIGIQFLSQATNKKQEYIFFGDKGHWFPNLVLTSISASATVILNMAH
jgi:hypothetical protein